MKTKFVLLVTSKKQADACKASLGHDDSIVVSVINTGGQITDLDKRMPVEVLEDQSIKENWVLRPDKEKLLEYIGRFKERGFLFVLAADGSNVSEKIAFDLASLLLGERIFVTTLESVLKEDILSAVAQRREVDEDRARAEAVRKIIDMLIGYRLSEAMRWHLSLQGYDIPASLQIGRVMAPGLKLLSDNQKEIDSHIGEPYVRIKCWYIKKGEHFEIIDKTRFFEDSYEHQAQYKELKAKLATNPHVVTNYERKQKEESPPPPLSLSELEMASFNAFVYNSETTAKIAEDLYLEGFITNYRTSSNMLNPDILDEMITYLYATMDEDLVVDVPRRWRSTTEGRQGEYAISPTKFSDNVEPGNIKKLWSLNGLQFGKQHFDVYRLIWHRTLATQIDNAFFDVSELSIQVSNHKMKIMGKKVLTGFDDEGNEVERWGWLSLDEHLLRRSMTLSEDGYKTEDAIIPYHEVGEEAVCTDITDFNWRTQPPKHFGEARFIKTLERMKVTRANSLSMIAKKMVERGLVEYRGKVLFIRALGKRVAEWIEINAPFLCDVEQVVEVSRALEEIEMGEHVDSDHLVREILGKIQKVEEAIGYGEDERGKEPPSLVQIQQAKAIAREKKIRLGAAVFSSREKIEIFLRKHGHSSKEREIEIEETYLGKCPACKSGGVVKREKFYGCSAYKTTGCRFGVNIAFARDFLAKFGKDDVTDEVLDALVKTMLSKEYAEVPGMVSQKGINFVGKITLAERNGYWNFAFFRKGQPRDREKRSEF